MAWYIDSLDVLAGMAFASKRDPDLLNGSSEIAEPDAQAYIAPPDFRPILGVSRSTALAAARGSFQLGLFIKAKRWLFPLLMQLPSLLGEVFSEVAAEVDRRERCPPYPKIVPISAAEEEKPKKLIENAVPISGQI